MAHSTKVLKLYETLPINFPLLTGGHRPGQLFLELVQSLGGLLGLLVS